jgi:hypothetical protein
VNIGKNRERGKEGRYAGDALLLSIDFHHDRTKALQSRFEILDDIRVG